MRLNHECVRDILLELEDTLTLDDDINLEQIKELNTTKKYGEDITIYTIYKLFEANFLIGKPFYASDELFELTISSITWEGHQFLDNIRDNYVWKRTKGITSKLSSISISLISTIAANVISELIKKQL